MQLNLYILYEKIKFVLYGLHFLHSLSSSQTGTDGKAPKKKTAEPPALDVLGRTSPLVQTSNNMII